MLPTLTGRMKATFEHDVHQREEVRGLDIHISRLTGLAPADVDVLCDFTREEGLFLVIRCPKRPARHFQGRFDPKPMSVKTKSDPSTGLVRENGRVYVSDYDLMCLWRHLGDGYERIVCTSADPSRPEQLPPAAEQLLEKVNWRLKSPFQHGAQDDFASEKHPNVQMQSADGKLVDRFAVFHLGQAQYAATGAELKRVYDRVLGAGQWPYDEAGRHFSAKGSTARRPT